jgi:polyhydroxyalkanoate synthase subunit PhaC
MHEFTELFQKLIKGIDISSRLREEDLQIGVTPTQEVYREDKVVLYRFNSKVEHSPHIPILIVYNAQALWVRYQEVY